MQSSNKADNGGLNFVFESGSSGRENKKYVRSHAAKVGWSQRSRKQAQATNKDDVATTKEATPRKRRKTTHHDTIAQQDLQQQSSICSPLPTQSSVNRPLHFQPEAGVEASGSPSLLATGQVPPQIPPQQHAPSRDSSHFAAYSTSQTLPPTTLAPLYTAGPSSSSSPPRYFHRPGQPASVRAQHEDPTCSTRTAAGAPPAYPFNQDASHWYARPEPVQPDSVAQQSVVPLFRPAASPGPMHPPQVMSGPDFHHPAPQTSSPMPSPRLPPIANVHSSRSSLVGANWRQYDNMPVLNSGLSQPSTPVPGTPIRHDENIEAPERTPQPSSPKRKSTPAFLEVVLNEECPMWKSADSSSDSFGVFPVRWQPFYGRLLQNCGCSRLCLSRRRPRANHGKQTAPTCSSNSMKSPQAGHHTRS